MATCIQIPHYFFFRRSESLTAGQQVQYRIANLRNVYVSQGSAPDSVMYLVRDNKIVAYNDDFGGPEPLASEFSFIPQVSGTYTLIIHAWITKTPGYCDLYKGVGGGGLAILERDVLFYGTRVDVGWAVGATLQTSGATGDPFLLFRTGTSVGSDLLLNDDGAGNLNSKIALPGSGAAGTAIVGSFSRFTEGSCTLCALDPAGLPTSSLRPYLSPTPDAPGVESKRMSVTPQMDNYMRKLELAKPELEKLDSHQRDERVLALQREFLSEEEIRRQISPMPQATTDFVRCQQNFIERCKGMTEALEKMSDSERSEQLAQLKEKLVGP